MTTTSQNRETFCQLVRSAAAFADSGAWERAAVQAQLAARFAWTDHAGLFASKELEDLISRIRTSVPAAVGRPESAAPGRQVIVHVATQLYGTGGHTQSIARWIREDPLSSHKLVLTRQGMAQIPAKVTAHLPDSSDVLLLDRRPGGLLRRAAALRRFVRAADVVIVHAHPYDVVPALALGLEGSPPAVYVNHADHVFWVGTSAATVTMNLRQSGRDLSVSRRGIAPERCMVANRPLELSPAGGLDGFQRSAARLRLGVADGELLVVSAAAGSKYSAVGQESLIGLFSALIRHRPEMRLLVAGPAAEGQWLEAAGASGGRIRALGRLPEVQGLLSVADVYLDSYPFSSLTSLLEAGAHGLPLVTFRGHPEECAVLGSDSPGMVKELFSPATEQEFIETFAALADSPALRAARGTASREAVLAGHSPAAWAETVSAIYTKARAAGTSVVTGATPWQDGPLDQLVGMIQSRTGFSGVGAAAADVLTLRGPAGRIRHWLALRKSQQLGPWRLLPEWVRAGIADTRRRLSPPAWQTAWPAVHDSLLPLHRRQVR